MRQTALGIAIFVFGSTAFAADAGLLNLVMPQPKVLAGVNANNIRTSPFGQFILSKAASLQQNQSFTALTGFDPLQDVFEVLAASTADPAQPDGLVLVRGNFRVDQIVSAVSGRPNVAVQTSAQATLISFVNPKNKVTNAVAFVDHNTIAILGDLAGVQAAIDRVSSPGSLDPALSLRVDNLSRNADEWLVSTVPFAQLIPANAAAASGPGAQVLPILKSIQSFSIGVKFGADVQVTGQALTDNAGNASALGAVINLVVALASGDAGKDPRIAQLVHLLQGLNVHAEDKALNINLAIPETQIEALLNNLPVHTVRSSVPQRRPKH